MTEVFSSSPELKQLWLDFRWQQTDAGKSFEAKLT